MPVNGARQSIGGVVVEIVPSIQPNRLRPVCGFNKATYIRTPQEFAAAAVNNSRRRANVPNDFKIVVSCETTRPAVSNTSTRSQARVPSPSNAPRAGLREPRGHDLRL